MNLCPLSFFIRRTSKQSKFQFWLESHRIKIIAAVELFQGIKSNAAIVEEFNIINYSTHTLYLLVYVAFQYSYWINSILGIIAFWWPWNAYVVELIRYVCIFQHYAFLSKKKTFNQSVKSINYLKTIFWTFEYDVEIFVAFCNAI